MLFFGSPNGHQPTHFQFSNTFMSKIDSSYYAAIYFGCSPTDEVIYTDGVFSDYFIGQSYLWEGQFCKSIVMRNMIFENSIGNQYQSISLNNAQNIELYNITLKNITGSEFPQTSFITTNKFPSTSFIIDGVTIEDCSFLATKLYATYASLDYFELVNVHFSNVTITSGESLVVLDNIKHLLLKNMTFDNVSNSDTINEGSAIILLNSLNLNSDVTTEVYEVGLKSIDNLGYHSEANFLTISKNQFPDQHYTSTKNNSVQKYPRL